jgi:hypothetical protein
VNFSGAGPGVRAVTIEGKVVPDEELDAWYLERMLFDWRGQPFGLFRYENGLVSGGYSGNDLSFWPRENGLDGSRNDGWYLIDAPESEIENLRVEKHDILARRNYRHTFNVDPPKDLFVAVRPATDQEWIKE